MSGAHRFPLETQQQCHGHGQQNGAQVAEFLEQQCRTCGNDYGQVGAGVDAQLGDKGQNGDAHQAGCGLHFLMIQDLQRIGPCQNAQEQCVENREDDERSFPHGDLDLSDAVGDENEYERQQIQIPFPSDSGKQRWIGISGLFHGAPTPSLSLIRGSIADGRGCLKGQMGSFCKFLRFCPRSAAFSSLQRGRLCGPLCPRYEKRRRICGAA